MQGTPVWSLVWGDSTRWGATKSVHCNCWACALKLLKHTLERVPAAREGAALRGPCNAAGEWPPLSTWEKAHVQPKISTYLRFLKASLCKNIWIWILNECFPLTSSPWEVTHSSTWNFLTQSTFWTTLWKLPQNCGLSDKNSKLWQMVLWAQISLLKANWSRLKSSGEPEEHQKWDPALPQLLFLWAILGVGGNLGRNIPDHCWTRRHRGLVRLSLHPLGGCFDGKKKKVIYLIV